MPDHLSVPPLRSGGIMLSYGCNQHCRHCIYRSGPDAGSEWMGMDRLDKIFASLKLERRLIDVHFGGGELTLKPDLLQQAIQLASSYCLRMSYLETNGFFADTVEKGVEVLRPLKDAGLPAILVSVSPYHNEFIPLRKTLNCIKAGERVFGEDGVFPWLGHFLPMLAAMDPEVPHTLEEFLTVNNFTPGDRRLMQLYPLTPGGRVAEKLRDFFPKQPASAFKGGQCVEMLTDVSHFHVDPYGILFTGACPGIASAVFPDLHGEKNLEQHPVFTTLAVSGPYGLMQRAILEECFTPDPEGYISPCDLCFQVRKSLHHHHGDNYPELQPAVFYR